MAEKIKNLFMKLKAFFTKFFSETNNIIYTCLIVAAVVILAFVCLFTSIAPDKNRLVYNLMDDGTYEVVDIKSTYRGGIFLREEITVPGEYKGVPVTKITKINSKHLEKITLSEGIKIIEKNAFNNASSLKEINLPNTLEYIGENAFTACQSLKYLYIPKSVTYVGNTVAKTCPTISLYYEGTKEATSNWGENWNASSTIITTGSKEEFDDFRPVHYQVNKSDIFEFEGNEYIINQETAVLVSWRNPQSIITVPSVVKNGEKTYTVSKVGNYSFSGLLGVEEIKIDSITCLDENAISGCKGLMRFHIGSRVETVGANCFEKCDNVLIYCEKDASLVNGWAENWATGRPVYYNVSADGFGYKDGFEYILDSNKNATITMYRLDSSEVVIPEELNGNKVVTLEQTSFQNLSKLTKITLANNITKIASNAFTNCRSLANIHIPKNITELGENVFANCNELIIYTEDAAGFNFSNWFCNRPAYLGVKKENIVVVNNIEYLLNGTEAILVRVRENVKTLDIKDKITVNGVDFKVTTIGNKAVENKTKLVEVELGKNIILINNNAFEGCSSLKQIYIPENVTNIENDAFAKCSNLIIYVESDTVSWTSERPIYLGVDMKNVIVVDGVEYLLDETNKTAILTIIRVSNDQIVLKQKVTVGKDDAKKEYTITKFGVNSFASATKLTKVFFEGTKAEFEALGNDLGILEKTKVYYYAEEKPEETNIGDYWHYSGTTVKKPTIWKKDDK